MMQFGSALRGSRSQYGPINTVDTTGYMSRKETREVPCSYRIHKLLLGGYSGVYELEYEQIMHIWTFEN